MKNVLSSAPGNVFFFGEHFVVYGMPAIISSIGRRTYVEARSPERGYEVLVDSAGYGKLYGKLKDGRIEIVSVDAELEPARNLLNYCNEAFGMDRGVHIRIESEIPKASGGMSSSTAFLASFFHALNNYYGWDVELDEYLKHLYPFQKEIHGGAASGAELVSSVYGGSHSVVKKEKAGENDILVDFSPLNDMRFNILVGDTGIEAKTKITVSQVNNLYKFSLEPYEQLFEKYERVYEEASRAIARGDEKRVGMLMNENQKLLEQLDAINREVNEAVGMYEQIVEIASHELRELAKAAVEAGAYGAKLSGGGGGGIMIALVSSDTKEHVEDSMKERAKVLRLHNFRVYEATLGVEGAKLHDGTLA